MESINIHLFTVEYGYGWGTMVVVASDMQTAVKKFLERMNKETWKREDYDYRYEGTLDMHGDTWYFYQCE